MRPLIITPEKQDEIAAAVRRAEANPISFEKLRAGAVEPSKTEIALSDRKPGYERPPSEHVLIPIGYRAAFSIEDQPVGLCHHISVSVEQPGKLPSKDAVIMIAAAYGITRADSIWLEEFDPGHQAVNVIMVKARQ